MDEPRGTEASSPVPQLTDTSPLPPPPFSGPSGVGWGFLLYIFLVALSVVILSIVFRFLVPHSTPSLWRQFTVQVIEAVSVVGVGMLMARLEHRPFASYGLPPKQAFRSLFWVGTLWGFVACSALMMSLKVAGAYHFGGLAIGGLKIVKFAIFWAVLFALVSFFEDFFFRGYTLFTLSRGLGFWPSALLLSAAFGAVHLGNPGESKVGALGAGLIGLFFCFTVRRTGSLWFAVGMHMSWDWGETFFYSVPDSGLVAPGHLFNSTIAGPEWLAGGTVGPEGSVFVFILMALMALVFHFMFPAKPKSVEVGPAPTSGPGPTSTQATYQE